MPLKSANQLKKFVEIRNKSEFHSNFQFSLDAFECDFDVEELGAAKKTNEGRYEWNTPFGILIEKCGKLTFLEFTDKKY